MYHFAYRHSPGLGCISHSVRLIGVGLELAEVPNYATATVEELQCSALLAMLEHSTVALDELLIAALALARVVEVAVSLSNLRIGEQEHARRLR
jgi:hypothetical protein